MSLAKSGLGELEIKYAINIIWLHWCKVMCNAGLKTSSAYHQDLSLYR